MSERDEALKPCFKCRDSEELAIVDVSWDDPGFAVTCKTCDLWVYGETKQEAVYNWNTRPADLEPLGEKEVKHQLDLYFRNKLNGEYKWTLPLAKFICQHFAAKRSSLSMEQIAKQLDKYFKSVDGYNRIVAQAIHDAAQSGGELIMDGPIICDVENIGNRRLNQPPTKPSEGEAVEEVRG